AGLNEEQQRQYEAQGFVVFERLFEPEELQPVIRELDEAVDRLAHRYQGEGRLQSLCEAEDFSTRFLALCRQCHDMYNELTGSKPLGPATFGLLRHPKLVDIAEDLVGPEVHCEGRYRFRPKLPGVSAADFRFHEDTLYQAKRAIFVEQQ